MVIFTAILGPFRIATNYSLWTRYVERERSLALLTILSTPNLFLLFLSFPASGLEALAWLFEASVAARH